MRKLSVLIALCILATGAFAQSEKDDMSDRIEMIKQVRAEREMASAKTPKNGPAAALTVEEVGEPDSFGKNAKFFGTAATGIVYVYWSCDPAVLLAELELTLGADDRCLAAPTPGVSASATFSDLGRITIPARSADNVLFFLANNLVSYDLVNPTANPVFASTLYSPSITIESVALNDPAAIDPNTGLPMNGSFTTGVNGIRQNFKTLAGSAQELTFERYAGTSTTGFSRSYFAALGLPNNVINRIYRNPVTLKLNIRVRATYTTFGQFGYAMRILGN